MNIGRRYQILLLVLICMGIYYPTVFNTTLAIDDVDMVQRMVNGTISWQGLFSPRSSFYYRPLLILSFWVDMWLWDFQQTFSLVENVLFHAANTVLIYLIAERYLAHQKRQPSLYFCAALIFAVHPLATESINWMSGRTDLLGTFFVLLSVLILHWALSRGSYGFLLLSLTAFVAGVMSKEIMIFFLPAALYLISLRGKSKDNYRFQSTFVPIITYTLPILGGVGSYIVYRAFKRSTTSQSVFQVLDRIPYEGLDLLRVVFKVFGFYVKKLFLPLPLNFAIIDVSDMYTILGCIVFGLALWMLYQGSMRWAFLTIAFFLITPAIIIALTHVAWTPLAERYIYLPAAFLALGLVAAVQPVLDNRRVLPVAVSLLLFWAVPSAVASAQRSVLWQDKEALYADTLKKSPRFARLRNDYGVALLNNSRSDMALEQFREGQAKNGTYFALVNEARMLLMQGRPEEARTVLLKRYPEKAKLGVHGLKMLTHIEAKRLQQTAEPFLKTQITRELFEVHELLYQKTKDPFNLYRSGQIALRLGEKRKAQALFFRAYRRAPASAHYKSAAKKLSETLQNELQ